IIVMMLFGWFLQATGIISMNIEREVVQHSRQYTESKQASLQNLYSQYAGLALQIAKAETDGNINVADAAKAQQIALITQMKREATNIPASEVPVEIYRLIH
ncbi:MAG: hypothetical protein Q7T50_00185, partial [Candidatus Magasanikbacteria bacterium]|nr:hypothetical protein [Candidatus Magasanikbacteria bacterium]